MNFDDSLPYHSGRMPIMARNVVSTSQPLATQAGLNALHRGGNAIDAALAAAITLTVVEPCSNGIGSDAFAIIWDGTSLQGFNASGKAPEKIDAVRLRKLDTMPRYGWDSVTVPGCVAAWRDLSERYGRLTFDDLFDAAIRYAADGFAVSPITAAAWARARQRYRDFSEFQRVFYPGGQAPAAGVLFRSPDQAKTLESIAESRSESFYRGRIAEALEQTAKAEGGALTIGDLAAHTNEWVSPMSMDFGGVTLHEIPPNGQGLAALIALGILRHTPLAETQLDSTDFHHLMIEAVKLAFADAYRNIAEQSAMEVEPARFLDEDYLKSRAALIQMDRAGDFTHGLPTDRGTVYLSTADESGMMVSFIQSNFCGFGSGVVGHGTGVHLQNRGHGFSTNPRHPNCVEGGKRPFHTIVPAFLTKDGEPYASFGVMGGSFQIQGHTQVVARMALFGQHPQRASDAPRWRVESGRKVLVEPTFPAAVAEELRMRGHDIEVAPSSEFGGAQIIVRSEAGYIAGSDHRKDGHAAGF